MNFSNLCRERELTREDDIPTEPAPAAFCVLLAFSDLLFSADNVFDHHQRRPRFLASLFVPVFVLAIR